MEKSRTVTNKVPIMKFLGCSKRLYSLPKINTLEGTKGIINTN